MGLVAQNAKNTTIDMTHVPDNLVFGLDIGTRSIVGTVGYKNSTNGFVVVAQAAAEHETRAMMDGQIHDIGQVARTVEWIHSRLEEMTGREYKDVCIAAAGRVLKTVEAAAEVHFNTENVVTSEQIYSLNMLGVEKAYETLRQEMQSDDVRFYCVGYSVRQYYQNNYPISNLEGHKCTDIRTELIATFLPDEVVDGLYAAVERAGLFVANLTLEPIAAINVAIPEKFRLLNLALVDVGAGTSDISITRDGGIIAYGMIPYAGDEITEAIARQYLTDFTEADRMKCASTEQEEVTYHDIMGLPQKISSEDLIASVSETVQMITKSISDKIVELNGGKPVSAIFVVGGGGKVRGFVENLAECQGIQKERVALRGSEVLGNVKFLQEDITVDSLLVTPIGICLNYYEQKNNFIFVTVNGERIKLYDNNKLTIMDAAMQVGFPNEELFPRRGNALTYYVDNERRMVRGEPGEAAVIHLNGRETGINTPIASNDKIEIRPSTKGEAAEITIGRLPEYKATLTFDFNGKKVTCSRFVSVNGELVSEFYSVKEGDRIQILDYYTLKQVMEFMDILYYSNVMVNNFPAAMDTKVYDNFTIRCKVEEQMPSGPGAQMDAPEEERTEPLAEEEAGEGEFFGESEWPAMEGTGEGGGFAPGEAEEEPFFWEQSGQDEQPALEKDGADRRPASGEADWGKPSAPEEIRQGGQPAFKEVREGGQSAGRKDGERKQPTFRETEENRQSAAGEISEAEQPASEEAREVRQSAAGEISEAEQPTSEEAREDGQSAAGETSEDKRPAAEEAGQKKTFAGQTVSETESGLGQNPLPQIEDISITVNGDAVVLKGKTNYILVDVLDFYPIDTSVAHGDHLETEINGIKCNGFTHPVKSGDNIRIEWVG